MPESNSENLKVIRLDNGEILFSEVVVNSKSKENGYLELHWPMKVMMRQDHEEKCTHLVLLKWMPFTDTSIIPISAKSIMSVSNLGQEYKEFYINTIKEIESDDPKEEVNRMARLLSEFDEQNALMN